MVLADPGAAAAKFLPFAAMSALVYEEKSPEPPKPPCEHPRALAEKEVLLGQLGAWKQIEFPNQPDCDDEMGLFYRVWTRPTPEGLDVALAFRGTGGTSDWLRGNLRWVTRFWPGPDQYDRSRMIADDVVKYFQTGRGNPGPGKTVRFYSTGHSLGGGLAQTVYYHRPDAFDQVYAFDPSPVTGYMEECPETRRQGCLCKLNWEHEARVYRVYESDEILSWVRLPLKLVLPLHRHIQEVRFGLEDGNGIGQHKMAVFAVNLGELAAAKSQGSAEPWYAGAGNAEDGKTTCTQMFEARQEKLCKQPRTDQICP
jgi:pimeloyl-ACP methyl ester carboxylesterase